MTDYSIGIKQNLLGGGVSYDDQINGYEQRFIAGDRTAVLSALILCSLHNKPIPQWARYELLSLDEEILYQGFDDVNEFFGFKKVNSKTREYLSNLGRHERRIVSRLIKHRMSGGDFQAETLQGIAAEMNITFAVFKEIYKKHKEWLKPLNIASNPGAAIIKLSLFEIAQQKDLDNQKKHI